jgi:hypothetical protein
MTFTFRPQLALACSLLLQADSSAHAVTPVISELRFYQERRLVHGSEVFKGDGHQPFIVPAQQKHIMELQTAGGKAYIWMGDLWCSRPDNIKGHDQQYWSAPLRFNLDGTIQRMEWVDECQVEVRK